MDHQPSVPSCLLIVSKQKARALPHVILAIPTSLGNILKLSVASVLKECVTIFKERTLSMVQHAA